MMSKSTAPSGENHGMSPAETIPAYFAAINRSDFAAVAALYADDGEFRPPGRRTYRGRAAIIGRLTAALEGYAEHDDRLGRVIVQGSTGVAEIHFHGTHSSGVVIDFDAVDVFDFGPDGQIAVVRTYYDTAGLRRQLRDAQQNPARSSGTT
jgi:steroid delta-isomerase-like uncharacterized protein